jgi:hypothetical protein
MGDLHCTLYRLYFGFNFSCLFLHIILFFSGANRCSRFVFEGSQCMSVAFGSKSFGMVDACSGDGLNSCNADHWVSAMSWFSVCSVRSWIGTVASRQLKWVGRRKLFVSVGSGQFVFWGDIARKFMDSDGCLPSWLRGSVLCLGGLVGSIGVAGAICFHVV